MLAPDQLNDRLAPLFPGLMGVRVLQASPDEVRAEMLVRPDLCTAGGILHGGAYMAFADTLGAVGTVMSLAKGQSTTTTGSSTKFIRGAPVGSTVTGHAAPRAPHARLANRGSQRRRQAVRGGDADAVGDGRCLIPLGMPRFQFICPKNGANPAQTTIKN